MEWMDTHCHLCLLQETQGILEQVRQDALMRDVKYILDVATGPAHWQAVIDHARCLSGVFAAVGVHPTCEATEIDWQQLALLAQDPSVIAIGECGLDFYHAPEAECQQQYPRFEQQIALAKQVNKPLIIHTRQSAQQTLAVLKAHSGEVTGIMHCFVEDEEIAQQALDIGFYLSFSGIVTFKNAKLVQRVAQWAPADRILIETDSPYLAPVPHRGQPNQPAFVADVGVFMAQLRGISVEALMMQLAQNAQALFGHTAFANANAA